MVPLEGKCDWERVRLNETFAGSSWLNPVAHAGGDV